MKTLDDPALRHRADTIVSAVPTGLFVGGRWREASDGGTFAVTDPATGEVLAEIASATGEDAVAALDAAAAAQPAWERTPARERSDVLRRAFDLVREHAEDLAWLMTLEMGKPLAEARAEVAYGNEFLRWFSEEAVRLHGRYADTPEGTLRMLVRRKAVGPSYLVTPWNFPLAMATRKLGPALAAGCTAILKPAHLTPLTSLFLTRLLVDAGVPAGVVGVLPGADPAAVSEPLLADPRLRKLSFTGSTPVGRLLLRQSADRVLRTSMELGGNAAFLVFADADLDAAVDSAVAAKMRNIGEACTAANRFLVHEAVADEFSRRLAERLDALTLGHGLVPGVTCGPLVDERAREKVGGLVADATARGASVLTGGAAVAGPGHFFAPTVLTQVPRDARIFGEEVFGPVAPVFTFADEDEAVALANATEFGLAAYVCTTDLARGLRIGDRLEVGLLGLNTGVISNAAAPFGGVKQSGLGREGGLEGIAEYTSTQYVGVADPWAGVAGA